MACEGKKYWFYNIKSQRSKCGSFQKLSFNAWTHGDCMCLELIQCHYLQSNVLATKINLIVIMEVEQIL